MKTKIPIWITTYFYSAGTVDEIKKGDSKRIQITKEIPDYTKSLNKNGNLIIVPKVVGIYQEREPAKETAYIRKERRRIEKKRDEVIEKRLSERWGIIDNLHPYLIYVGYEPNVFTRDSLKGLLNDEMDRVGLSSISSMPNFFEKDQITLCNILVEEGEMYSDDVSKVSAEERVRVRRKFIPQIEKLSKQLKPFGLTRNEFYFIKSYYD